MAGRSLSFAGTLVASVVSVAAQAMPGQWTNSLKPHGTPGAPITLAEGGSTDYRIVIPADPTSQEQKAAEDLAHWLNEMTGATFPIVSDDRPATGREIRLGRSCGMGDGADLGDEGSAIAVEGERLLLRGGRLRGPIYAVYALLEEDLGLRWYAPDADRIPHRPTVQFWPVPRSYQPRLMIRDPFYKSAFDGTWSLCNRTNAFSAPVPEEWGGHVTYAAFVHTAHQLVPPGEHFGPHPEWFMLTEAGERSAHQLCMTHPEAIAAAIEGTQRLLRANPTARVVSVSKTDGGGTCKCDRCRALDEAEGSECASLLFMVNRVAEAIEEEFPQVTVSTLAYLETVRPPKTIRPRRNVAMRLCTDNCMWAHPFTPARDSEPFSAAMESWAAIHDQIHIWDYVVNFSHYTAPMPNMDVVADNIRYFVENNATGIMAQGAYQSVGAERDAMRSWVIAKLLWDPSRDVWALVHDFVYGYFGPAARPIWEYNMLLRQTGIDHAEALASPQGGIRYGMNHEFLSDEFLDRATELYDRAEALAGDGVTLARVRRDRLPLMYVRLCEGPDAYGGDYAALVAHFADVVREVGLTHVREGAPDVEAKIQAWSESD